MHCERCQGEFHADLQRGRVSGRPALLTSSAAEHRKFLYVVSSASSACRPPSLPCVCVAVRADMPPPWLEPTPRSEYVRAIAQLLIHSCCTCSEKSRQVVALCRRAQHNCCCRRSDGPIPRSKQHRDNRHRAIEKENITAFTGFKHPPEIKSARLSKRASPPPTPAAPSAQARPSPSRITSSSDRQDTTMSWEEHQTDRRPTPRSVPPVHKLLLRLP